MRWCGIVVIGFLVILLFCWFVFWKKQEFDGPLLGLLTLGLAFMGTGILRPPSIKYGQFELADLKKRADEINQQAEEATKLALETAALLTWNQGRFGGGVPGQEEIATNILKSIYGSKAMQFRGGVPSRVEILQRNLVASRFYSIPASNCCGLACSVS